MDKVSLLKSLNDIGIHCHEDELQNLEDLMSMTLSTNEKFNLTAIKDEDSFRELMIYDSALALLTNDFHHKKVIDIGTGAGFPGLVLAILDSSIDMTLLDSTKKKVDYLSSYIKEKNYDVKTVCARAEEYAKVNREIYDIALARAVAPLHILLEMIIPLIKVNGVFLALKGKDAQSEIKSSEDALKKLHCKIEKTYEFVLPFSKEKREIIVIKKLKETPIKYPRLYAQIKKNPL